MAPRPKFHEILEDFAPNVYFQPPENVQLRYPCIIYSRDDVDAKFANNEPYDLIKKYMVTVIDRDPDSSIPNKIARLPMSSFNRFFTADGMNHDVYEVFF